MGKALIIAIFCFGFSGLGAQMTLIRELLVVFSGNELTIGIILANWLILEAGGCFFLGRRIGRRERVVTVFTWTAILFSVALPVTIHLARIAKPLLGISIGEEAGLPVILLVSFATLLPVSVLHGASFTFGCRTYALFSGARDSSIGRVYIWETVGTLFGGIAWTFLIIPHLHSFQTAAVLAMLNAFACLVVLTPRWDHGRFSERATGGAAALLLVVAGYMLFANRVDALQRRSVQVQWGGQNVVHHQNSIYGNVCVVESQGHYIFFMDGTPSLATPVPDIALVETFVHIPLLVHPHPEKILVLSGGAGGVLSEILKHVSVVRVDYAELDPLILELMRKYRTPLTEAELTDPRVDVKHLDGRLFLRKTAVDYDVILTGLSGPEDLQANRFFTLEFFSLAAEKLRDGGILAIKLPGSFTYRNDELRDLNASIYHTLKSVFPYVRPIPGDGANLFLASSSGMVEKFNAALFVNRLRAGHLSAEVPMPWHIEQKLNPNWKAWFADFIVDGSEQANRDFHPLGVFYNAAYWSSLLTPRLRRPFDWFQRLSLGKFLIATASVVGLVLLFRFRLRRLIGSGIPLCIATTGFGGMVFDLTLLFAFQAIYGYVFSWIGLLVAGFMTGAVCGAMLTNSPRAVAERRLFMIIDLTVAGFAFGLSLAFSLLQPYLDMPSALEYIRWLFLVALFLGGMVTGAQFPLANRLYLKRDDRFGRTAGLLYGADLLGGWFGGIAGGVVLLPILGFPGTCVAVGAIKLSGFAILRWGASELQ